MQVVNGLLGFLENFLSSLNGLFSWLNSPFLTRENMPLGIMILEKLGISIDWMYNLTPLVLLSSSLVVLLGFILLIKFVGMILDAIPLV